MPRALTLHPALRWLGQDQEPQAPPPQAPTPQAPTQGEAQTQAPGKELDFLERNQTTGAGEQEAQPGPPPAGGPMPGGCGPETMIMVVAMVAIFYFLLIRPQQKQEKQRKAMLAAIKVGDDVVTTGGIHGTISSMTADTVVLRIDPKVKITVDRAHIARVQGGEPSKASTGGNST